ncbi:50S ribosomal protein L25/general stress protein Ctc [Panacagrimonas sp.]|uniref:50S ribosomal protein L25/general stress protein Ctc n=1 Tax=Panacagrimonas sp. TaxID=2480088 RepID=UPI003B515650
MKQSFTVNAEPRVDQGKGASRRLRRTGHLPAIVYGGNKPPQSITVNHNELWKHLKHEAFYSKILTLNIGAESEQVVLKDLHRHPVREEVMHMDLQRVLADVLIRMRVPVHFKGGDIAPGVKTGGGMIDHLMNEVEVECLPANLPEFLELDVSAMDVGESLHLSQLPVPEGVTLVELKHDNDAPVVSLHLPRVAVEEEEETPAAEAAAEEPKKDEKKK